jgi:hypothetical protein
MKSIIIATAALLLGLAPTVSDHTHAIQITLPNVYQWKVRMPNDIPFESCTIIMRAGGPEKNVVLQRGQSYTWTAPYNTPLTVIDGWRFDENKNRIMLISRTCAGTDFERGAEAVDCSYSVSLKICAKTSVTPDHIFGVKYGFCPE